MLNDPTLEAADKALETSYNASQRIGSSIGMGSLGNPCSRALFFKFRRAKNVEFNAKTIKMFIDGHHGEDVQAERLRAVDGVVLETINPLTGKQYEFTEFNGHVRGFCDGIITGLRQNPEEFYVWEHKQTAQKKFDALLKLIEKFPEHEVLQNWDENYYAQSQLYMKYSGIKQHYLTVASAGGRDTISVITLYDEDYANQLIKKAERIIFTNDAPERINNSPAFYLCKWCDYHDICHSKEIPAMNCRTCLHSTPEVGGNWSCTKHDIDIGENFEHVGCDKHLYLPDMLGSKAVEAVEGSVIYADGRVNFEGGLVKCPTN